MVTVNLEVLWIVSDRIVHFLFFVKFHKSWTAIIFSFWTLTEHVSYASKELLIKQKTSSTWWVYTLEGLWMVSDRIFIFRFFVKFHRSWPVTIFSFWTLTHMHKKAPNQAKDLINIVRVSLEGLWMVSDRIVDFQFFVKFHRSGPAPIFCFWTLREHVSYASKNHPIKQKTSSTWWVSLWKDYELFLIELSIFDSSSNFIGQDL